MYWFREFVSDGGLLSYGPDLMEMFRRSATYANRLLNGALRFCKAPQLFGEIIRAMLVLADSRPAGVSIADRHSESGSSR